MKEERMYLLRKGDEDFFSLIIFKDKIDFRELEGRIKTYSKIKSAGIDDIIDYLYEEYDIDEVINFDYISKNTMDIDNEIIYGEL